MLTRIILHNFVVFAAKNFWVFINFTVHRNKLIDMFTNNINRVTNKNISLFFFPSDIKLAWKTKQKHRNWPKMYFSLFLWFFFLKIQDIRKSKTPIFERDCMKTFRVKCWPFRNKPNSAAIYESNTMFLASLIHKVIQSSYHICSNFCTECHAWKKYFFNIKISILKPAIIMSSQIETWMVLFLSNLSKSFIPTCRIARIAGSYSYSSRIGIVWWLNRFGFNPGKDLK